MALYKTLHPSWVLKNTFEEIILVIILYYLHMYQPQVNVKFFTLVNCKKGKEKNSLKIQRFNSKSSVRHPIYLYISNLICLLTLIKNYMFAVGNAIGTSIIHTIT